MIGTAGNHHVTSFASDPQHNVDFYTEVLGHRLVKRTGNFDYKYTFHRYDGVEMGTPGTILAIFPFEIGLAVRVGHSQACATSFRIPQGAVVFWIGRFDSQDVVVGSPQHRFDEAVFPFRDYDGQSLELVTGTTDIGPWATGPVPTAYTIRGFQGVRLAWNFPSKTAQILELLGYEQTETNGGRTRFSASSDRAAIVDVPESLDAPQSRQRVGTVYHVAFRAFDKETQLEWRNKLSTRSPRVSSQNDRNYIESVYFREPGGLLFEIAMDESGFTRDEATADLGTELQRPPWVVSDRHSLEKRFPELNEPEGNDD